MLLVLSFANKYFKFLCYIFVSRLNSDNLLLISANCTLFINKTIIILIEYVLWKVCDNCDCVFYVKKVLKNEIKVFAKKKKKKNEND